MKMTLTAFALGALLGLGACTGSTTEDSGDSADTDTTNYEGARVRRTTTGFRVPVTTPVVTAVGGN
jgi:hypothetical protein